MPKKLPPGEALARHIARNKAKNEKRKAALIAYKIANGIPTRVSTISDERKAQMREYTKNRRAALKSGKLKPEKQPKPTKQPKRIITKPMQQSIKQQPPKAVRPPKPDLFKQQPVTRKNSDEGKIRVRIDHKTEVYVFPDQDIEAVKARYLNR